MILDGIVKGHTLTTTLETSLFYFHQMPSKYFSLAMTTTKGFNILNPITNVYVKIS